MEQRGGKQKVENVLPSAGALSLGGDEDKC